MLVRGRLPLIAALIAYPSLSVAQVAPAAADTGGVEPTKVISTVEATPQPILTLADRTPVRLMVLREISGNSAKPGEPFKLRVDEAVVVGGVTVIPIGATATGEIVAAAKNGRVAAAGSITARLISVESSSGPVPLTGTQGSEGDSNTGGLALGIAGFGLLGLLSRGNEGKLKAGAILTGYVDGTFRVDPGSGFLTRVATPAPEPIIIGPK